MMDYFDAKDFAQKTRWPLSPLIGFCIAILLEIGMRLFARYYWDATNYVTVNDIMINTHIELQVFVITVAISLIALYAEIEKYFSEELNIDISDIGKYGIIYAAIFSALYILIKLYEMLQADGELSGLMLLLYSIVGTIVVAFVIFVFIGSGPGAFIAFIIYGAYKRLIESTKKISFVKSVVVWCVIDLVSVLIGCIALIVI